VPRRQGVHPAGNGWRVDCGATRSSPKTEKSWRGRKGQRGRKGSAV